MVWDKFAASEGPNWFDYLDIIIMCTINIHNLLFFNIRRGCRQLDYNSGKFSLFDKKNRIWDGLLVAARTLHTRVLK